METLTNTPTTGLELHSVLAAVIKQTHHMTSMPASMLPCLVLSIPCNQWAGYRGAAVETRYWDLQWCINGNTDQHTNQWTWASLRVKGFHMVNPDTSEGRYEFSVSKIRKNIWRSHTQVTLELYCHFRCLQILCFQINLHLPSAVLLSGFQSSLWALKSTE